MSAGNSAGTNSLNACLLDASVTPPVARLVPTSCSAVPASTPRDGDDATVTIDRSSVAFNEFQENNDLLIATFPHLFPIGVGPPRNGSLSIVHHRHLLLQYHTRFAKCPQLVFLLFNQLQRHAGSRALSAAVRNNSEAFKVFQELSDDPLLGRSTSPHSQTHLNFASFYTAHSLQSRRSPVQAG